MAERSSINVEDGVNLEVELLNQTCLDLVAQIERLERENAHLKKKLGEMNEALEKPDNSI